MMVFKVETYQEAVTGFDTTITIKPDYVFTVMKFPLIWWFPWFRWFAHEYGVCTNLRQAEKHSVKKAIHLARILNRKTKTRIMRETSINRKKTKDVIWQEGWLIARDLWPWYRVVFNWLFFPKAKPEPVKTPDKHAAKTEQPVKKTK
jgi:hypothetical protein